MPRGALSFVADLTQSKRKHKFCNAIINWISSLVFAKLLRSLLSCSAHPAIEHVPYPQSSAGNVYACQLFKTPFTRSSPICNFISTLFFSLVKSRVNSKCSVLPVVWIYMLLSSIIFFSFVNSCSTIHIWPSLAFIRFFCVASLIVLTSSKINFQFASQRRSELIRIFEAVNYLQQLSGIGLILFPSNVWCDRIWSDVPHLLHRVCTECKCLDDGCSAVCIATKCLCSVHTSRNSLLPLPVYIDIRNNDSLQFSHYEIKYCIRVTKNHILHEMK